MTNAGLGVPVAILAGGLATRMRPLTEKIPKVLLTVADRPFLEHQLAGLRQQGIREVVLCVGFLGEMIEEMFGDGSAYGMRLQYSYDGPVLLGTGGALRRALPLLGDEFFVLYGDSYLQIDFVDVHREFRRSGRAALMTVFENHNRWDTSNVEFSGGIVKTYDKQPNERMRYIDYGLSVLRRDVFAGRADGVAFDLADLMKDLARRGELAGYEATERFFEIGSPSGLVELDRLLRTEMSHSAASPEA